MDTVRWYGGGGGAHVLGHTSCGSQGGHLGVLPDACWLAYGVYMHAMEWRRSQQTGVVHIGGGNQGHAYWLEG